MRGGRGHHAVWLALAALVTPLLALGVASVRGEPDEGTSPVRWRAGDDVAEAEARGLLRVGPAERGDFHAALAIPAGTTLRVESYAVLSTDARLVVRVALDAPASLDARADLVDPDGRIVASLAPGDHARIDIDPRAPLHARLTLAATGDAGGALRLWAAADAPP